MKSYNDPMGGDDFSVNSRASSLWPSGINYADSYNRVAQMLREALLRHGGDSRNHRQIVRNIFRRIDENGSGVLTDQEMKDFVQSPELNLFGNDSGNIEKFTELLVQQIDVNRDGTVSLQELEDFLFPSTASGEANEIGIVLDLCRKALIRIIASSGAASAGNDEALLAEFVKIGKAIPKRGNQIESRIARKALENLVIPEIGRNLLSVEIDGVIHSMDANNDGIISAKDFKGWLFPQNNNDNREFLVRYLTKVIDEKFHGNVRHMFNTFKTYGIDRVSRADFITRMKALDSGLPRQFLNELADGLCGKDKMISFPNIIDFLDIKNYREPLPEGEFEDEGEGDDSEDEEVFTVVPADKNRPVEDIVSSVLNDIITNIESNSDDSPSQAADRRSLLLSMHDDTNHYANSQNHIIDDGTVSPRSDQSFNQTPPFLRRHSRSNSPRSNNQDLADMDPSPRSLQRKSTLPSVKISPRSHHSVGSLSPRSNSQFPISTSASMDEYSVLKRSSSQRGTMGGPGGGSMYLSMMDNMQHLQNSSPAGLKRVQSVDSTGWAEAPPLDQTGQFSTIASSTADMIQSPITADEMEEARRLLQETRRQRGKELSPLAKMKQSHQNYATQDSVEFDGNDTLQSVPPPPPPPETSEHSPHQQEHHRRQSDKDSLKYGALGYSAQQLVEFGYLKHTGRWRGFPYDSWSCCNTSEAICPLAPKVNHMSPKKSRETLFIHSEKVTPTKTRQQQMRQLSHSIYIEDDNDNQDSYSNAAHQGEEQRRLVVKVRNSQDSQRPSHTSKVGKGKTSLSNSRARSSFENNHSPQPRAKAPVLTKFTMDPETLFNNTFQKSSTKLSQSQERHHLRGSSQSRRPNIEVEQPAAHQIEGNELKVRPMVPSQRAPATTHPSISSASQPQHIHHHERVIERVIVKPMTMPPPPSLPSATILAQRVEESVKRSTDKVLSSYERALKELRKELEISRNQTTNRDSKVYLTVEKQNQAIEDLKKHVQQNMLVLRRSIVDTLEKQQKEQNKNMQEQKRIQHNMERQLNSDKCQPRSQSVPPASSANANDTSQQQSEQLQSVEQSKIKDELLPSFAHPPGQHDSQTERQTHHSPPQVTHELATDGFDGDLKAYRHLTREVADLKDSPMTYIVGDHPLHLDAHPSTLDATGLSAEALDTLFDEGNKRSKSRSNKKPAPPKGKLHSARSVSPNYRYQAPSILANEPPKPRADRPSLFAPRAYQTVQNNIVRKSSVKPWIPAANHANHLFNRIAVVNYSKGHTASNSAVNPSSDANASVTANVNRRSVSPGQRLTHRNLESYPDDERRRHAWDHEHELFPPHDISRTTHFHQLRSSPSPISKTYDAEFASLPTRRSPSKSPSRLDTLLARHVGSKPQEPVEADHQQKSRREPIGNWPTKDQIKPHEFYFAEDDQSFFSPITSKRHAVEAASDEDKEWKYLPKMVLTAKEAVLPTYEEGKMIDYRLLDVGLQSEPAEKASKRRGPHKRSKDYHKSAKDRHQHIPMSAMLETKDEWWSKIMEEKKRREEEAYQRALH